MPLIWKSISKNFLKVFLLSNALFASVLVLGRVYEIARFAALGGGFFNIFLFTLLQFPFILPISFPLSSMIAAIAIVHRMNSSSELTSLRSFGFSIKKIFYPIVAFSILFCGINALFAFAITPSMKHFCKILMIKVTTENPLSILQNNNVAIFKNSLLQYSNTNSRKDISNVLFAHKSTNGRISILKADNIKTDSHSILCKNAQLIHYIPKENSLPLLYLENAEELVQPSMVLPLLMFKPKKQDLILQRKSLFELLSNYNNSETKPKKKKEIIFEILRRLYLSTGPWLLTTAGISFSLEIGRRSSKYPKYILFFLVSFYFIIYLTSKAIRFNSFILSIYYLSSILIIYLSSVIYRNSVERGKELLS